MADDQQTAPADPAALYAQLTPEQRAAFAQQFQQQFQQSSDPKSQQLAASVDPKTATPQQVAEMHEHAAAAHPGVLRGQHRGNAELGLAGGAEEEEHQLARDARGW